MQSYFPLPYSYRERQQRCRQQYGFACGCPRCQVGASGREGAGRSCGAGAALAALVTPHRALSSSPSMPLLPAHLRVRPLNPAGGGHLV